MMSEDDYKNLRDSYWVALRKYKNAALKLKAGKPLGKQAHKLFGEVNTIDKALSDNVPVFNDYDEMFDDLLRDNQETFELAAIYDDEDKVDKMLKDFGIYI